MSTVKERLKEIMDALELNPLSPSTTCEGITKNMMQKLWASKTETVTTNILVPFCKRYSKVNCNYLLRGEGSMFLDDDTQTTLSQKEAQQVTLARELIDVVKKIIEFEK